MKGRVGPVLGGLFFFLLSVLVVPLLVVVVLGFANGDFLERLEGLLGGLASTTLVVFFFLGGSAAIHFSLSLGKGDDGVAANAPIVAAVAATPIHVVVVIKTIGGQYDGLEPFVGGCSSLSLGPPPPRSCTASGGGLAVSGGLAIERGLASNAFPLLVDVSHDLSNILFDFVVQWHWHLQIASSQVAAVLERVERIFHMGGTRLDSSRGIHARSTALRAVFGRSLFASFASSSGRTAW